MKDIMTTVVLVKLTYCFTAPDFDESTFVCVALHSIKVQQHLKASASPFKLNTS